jgi:hypothetical protein
VEGVRRSRGVRTGDSSVKRTAPKFGRGVDVRLLKPNKTEAVITQLYRYSILIDENDVSEIDCGTGQVAALAVLFPPNWTVILGLRLRPVATAAADDLTIWP